jgi:hypothetical protein
MAHESDPEDSARQIANLIVGDEHGVFRSQLDGAGARLELWMTSREAAVALSFPPVYRHSVLPYAEMDPAVASPITSL